MPEEKSTQHVAAFDLPLSSFLDEKTREVLSVKAALHVWEGLEHAFHYSPDLPQSRELYNVAIKFFDEHLGK